MINRKTLTAKTFLTKLFRQRKAFTLAANTIQKLEAQWIKEYCPVKVGSEIPLTGKDGYTRFLIEKIHVDVTPASKDDYSIGFSFSGIKRGEGLEDKKERVRFLGNDKPGEDESKNKKNTEATATAAEM